MNKFKRQVTCVAFLLFGVSITSNIFAQAQSSSTPVQLQQADKKVILKNLDYKTVFMQFHQKEIQFLKMKEIEMDQAVGLKDSQGNIEYAVMNPIITYKNLQGEQRFIAYIERFTQEDGELNTGHAMSPRVELYLFKRLNLGGYQLLSRTRPDVEISGSWGESHLSTEDFKTIQQFGKDQQGLIYSGGYTSTGSHTEMTFLIVLNESGWIEQYPFGISEDNSGAYESHDPKFAGYSKKYTLIKNLDAQNLFPMQIQYSKFGKMNWVDHFPKNGFKEVVKFSPNKNCFIHDNGKCNSDLEGE